jgi:DNA-directed RNA polymerase specialized sigma24 family protein
MNSSQINPVIGKDLTADQFETLLQRLDSDRERAAQSYENLRYKLIRFFEWSACAGAEELADETLDRVARKAGSLEIHDVVRFMWGVAKKVRLEVQKKSANLVQLSSLGLDCGPPSLADQSRQEQMKDEERFQRMRQGLQRLPEEDRTLFLAYYDPERAGFEQRKKLAENMGLSIGALRVRVNRLRDKLERYVPKKNTVRHGDTA